MRKDVRFKCVNHLGELSILLVETKKACCLWFGLHASQIDIALTGGNDECWKTLVKNKLRNSMGDDLLNHCLVTFIKREVFLKVSKDDIVKSFMRMRDCRVKRY
jgi:hypothetical protein